MPDVQRQMLLAEVNAAAFARAQAAYIDILAQEAARQAALHVRVQYDERKRARHSRHYLKKDKKKHRSQ
eukprot:3871352-Pleurochrysis_carterae.AAC.2